MQHMILRLEGETGLGTGDDAIFTVPPKFGTKSMRYNLPTAPCPRL